MIDNFNDKLMLQDKSNQDYISLTEYNQLKTIINFNLKINNKIHSVDFWLAVHKCKI